MANDNAGLVAVVAHDSGRETRRACILTADPLARSVPVRLHRTGGYLTREDAERLVSTSKFIKSESERSSLGRNKTRSIGAI